MADRYEDERRRRWGEGRSEWGDESERDWEEYEWRNRPYARREDSEYYREQDWGGRQGRMRPRYGGGYGPEAERHPSAFGPAYGREPYQERDWGRGRDWEHEQRQPRGRYRSPYEREFDREGDWDYRRRRAGYGGGYGRGFDREQERFGRGQYERFRDVDEEYDWREEGEPITTWTYSEYWFVPGPYAGLGPRDYTRSDERILEEVCERLTQHGQIDASDIEVKVQNSEITLKGTVSDRREKRLAEDLADSVFGVEDVQNHLRSRERQLGRVEEIRHEPPRTTARSGMTGTQGGTEMHPASRERIRQGMEVIGRDGERVGEVKEVRSNDFLVDRPMARDVYVPFSTSNVSQGRIRLHIRADEVNNQNWEAPEILSGEEGSQQGKSM